MNWYPPIDVLYEKYTQVESAKATNDAARAVTRISVFLSPGINKINNPAMIGVKMITLRNGNGILHLNQE